MSRAPIAIDFAQRKPSWSSVASLATAVAALVAVVAALYVTTLRSHTRELRAELNAMQWTERRAAARPSANAPITADEARSVNDAVRRLNLEWDRIFAALRGADAAVGNAAGRVSLLTLEPDPATGLVKLTAEARSLNAMLGYQKQLESQVDVASAVVTKHEVQLDNAQAPVRFVIEARMRPGLERTQ